VVGSRVCEEVWLRTFLAAGNNAAMISVLWRDGWLLSICIGRIFAYANFMVYAACLPILREQWMMTATQAGTIASGFMLGYTVSLVASSWLAEHFGPRRVFMVSSLATAVGAVLFGFFARDYTSGFWLYMLAALGQGGNYTPAIMIMAERYKPEARGGAVGWLIASTSVGYAFSLAVSGTLVAWGGYPLAFIGSGLLPALGAAILWPALRRVPDTVHSSNRAINRAGKLWGDVNARRLVAGYTWHCWELLGMWAWAPAFVAASLALSGAAAVQAAETASYLTASMHIVGALASFTMGHLSDVLGRRTVLLGLGAAGGSLSLSIGWLVNWPFPFVVGLILVYGFVAIGDSPVLSTALTETVPRGHLGYALAVRSLAGFGAGAISPTVFGVALDFAGRSEWPPAAAWGAAFMVLAIGGLGATWYAWRFQSGVRAKG
jgi:MFS family permease